jgi:hypothetical protein
VRIRKSSTIAGRTDANAAARPYDPPPSDESPELGPYVRSNVCVLTKETPRRTSLSYVSVNFVSYVQLVPPQV